MSQKLQRGAYHSDDLKNLPPDGGVKAWTAAFCASLLCFTSWGSISSYGVLINYYLTHDVIPGVSKIQYAFVAGCAICFMLFGGWLVAAILAATNIRFVLIVGTLLQLAGMLMASFSVNLWELLLTEGIVSGFGCGFLFYASMVLIPSWFLRRRPIASGMTFAGTGLGGCVFSLTFQAMIDRTHDAKWALRTVAIICAFLNLNCVIFSKLRKVPSTPSTKHQTTTDTDPENANSDVMENDSQESPDFVGKVDEKQNTDPEQKWTLQAFITAVKTPIKPRLWFQKLTYLVIGYFSISTLGYIMVLYSLSNFAVSIGVSSTNAAHCIAVFNACQFVGRLGIGFLATKYGALNISALMGAISVIFAFAFWIPITTFAQVMSFSVLMGLVIGYQFVSIAAIVGDFFGALNFSAVWSFISLHNSIVGLFAEAIALALKNDKLSKPFLHAQIFTGVCFTVSTLFLIPLREQKVRNILKANDEPIQAGVAGFFQRAFSKQVA